MGRQTEFSLDQVYTYLRHFHLSDSLYVIGSLSAILKFGYKHFNFNNIPPLHKQWILAYAKDEHTTRKLSIVLSRLSRLMILSGANDYRDKQLQVGEASFNRAFNIVANLVDDDWDESTEPDLAKYFGRMSQWQLPIQANRKSIIGRGYLLFCSIPNEQTFNYSMDAKLKEYYDLSCFEFMATGFAMWLLANGTVDYEIKVEIKKLKPFVNIESQKKFLELSSTTYIEYRKQIRGDDWKKSVFLKDLFSLDPFIKFPTVKVERSLSLRPNTYLVPQIQYFYKGQVLEYFIF